ncbi:DUF4810 domain-containing protein [Zoogloea sp.]|uniref:DUF4810 domain-containing protein n=1 Tax=Zoogloea sp. TaxID=49181 RepID=UPI0026335B99|nr:DUF4810 domain-containing protein [Zoogloea sp.]MDD3352038.1 DUF4810 domain-containing protein [Zoogloea sp.]
MKTLRRSWIVGLLLLSGCASQPQSLYYWGEYQPQVYGHFTRENGAEEQIARLEAGVEQARARGQSVPPGYMAHLGILHADSGRGDQMLRCFEAEKKLYPESAAYMDFLLRKPRLRQGGAQ